MKTIPGYYLNGEWDFALDEIEDHAVFNYVTASKNDEQFGFKVGKKYPLSFNAFSDPIIEVNGKKIFLQDLEQEILDKLYINDR